MTTDTAVLPLLPLPTGVLFPDMVVTVASESDQARRAVAADEVVAVPVRNGVYASIGVVARVEQRGGDGTVVLRALRRVRVGIGSLSDDGALSVAIAELDDAEISPRATQLATEYRTIARELLALVGGRRFASLLNEVRGPGALADTLGWWPDLTDERRIELLETADVEARIALAVEWATEALADARVASEIADNVRGDLDRTQREVILRRQLQAIQTELGEGSDSGRDELRERLDSADLPDAVRDAGRKELARLDRIGEQSPEAGWIRTWIETLLDVPWSTRSPEQLDLAAARARLDADHTGLEKVKDRLGEFLAVRMLRTQRDTGTHRRGGAILALVGPPGVGKTSLGQSVADALGRRFVRMALGGVHDEAELRGHRRTYVGARPGRIVRSLVEAGTMNPVILLDEIDKLGADWRGDPTSALLEVLDPEQNHTFRDHYLELELDLSDVVFIATANTLDRLPAPLLDRLEVISIEGYSDDEKLAIAVDHLLPRLIDRSGLRPGEVEIPEAVIRTVIGEYTREAGVRRLEQRLDRLVRRGASRLVSDPDAVPIHIGDADLRDALGRAPQRDNPAERTTTPGVATGLAVTGAGGDVLFVEAAVMDGEPGLTLTGQLGDVMKESGQIALSYLRAHPGVADLDGVEALDRRFHVHFPAGAVPKDGPSAGITMTTALVSALTGRRVRPDVAMTGEVTLHGRVLPIGGLKEKVLAAHRYGITEVIVPDGNAADLDDLPADVRDAVTVHLVASVDQVLDLALADR